MITVVAAVIEQSDRFLLTRRLDGTHLAGLWEFPGGKVHPGETHDVALSREIDEELGAQIEVEREILHTTHAYPEQTVSLHFYRCRLRTAPVPQLGQEMRWVARAELAMLGFPEADAELIRRLSTSAVP